MATIDLTTEPDAGQLARQVLGAETLAEARAHAQAVVDAEAGGDEPSVKRARRDKSPRERHEEAYTSLIVAVCDLLAKPVRYPVSFTVSYNGRQVTYGGHPWGAGFGLPMLRLPALKFDEAEAHWAKDPMAITPRSVRPELSFSVLAGSFDASVVPKQPPGTNETWPVCYAVREFLKGKLPAPMMKGSVDVEIAPEKTPLDNMTVGLLLDPGDFAKIQRMMGDGQLIGQPFFKACAAWAWALLKNEHDPEFPAEG